MEMPPSHAPSAAMAKVEAVDCTAGLFRVLSIVRKRTRVWLELFGLDRTFGTWTVFVARSPYERHGQRWKPYRVKRR